MARFRLPDRDVEFLNSLGVKWETGMDGGMGYVIMYDVGIDTTKFKVAGGGDKINILFMLPSGYPNTQIDMSSFYPDIKRADRKEIPNLWRFYNVNGFKWQTWSRHRSGGDFWNPETDGVASHLAYTDLFLQREVGLDRTELSSTRLVSTFTPKIGTGMKVLKFPEKPHNRLIINMG